VSASAVGAGRVRRWSTRHRLIVTLAVALTVILTVTTTVSILYMRAYVRDRIDDRLLNTSERIRASVVGLGGVRLDAVTVENMARPEGAAVVFERAGEPVLIANTDPGTAEALMAAGQDDGQPHRVPDRPEMTVIRLDVTGSGLSVIGPDQRVLVPDALVIGFDTGPSLATLQQLILVAAGGVLVAVIALVAATVLIVGRSLRPLTTMSEQAHAFAEGDRTVRLPVPDDPDLHRLAVTVNEAFDVQQTAEGRLRSFVADASHELRTPLTTATGWIELYLQGGLTDKAERDHAMQLAMTQLARMRVLIDELSLLARLDRARPLAQDPLDLTVLVGEVLDDARVTHPDRSFALHATGPATVLGDAPRLQQVLQNLLGNAVLHTPAGTAVEVTVRPARPDPGGRGEPVHTLLVTDHGPGIPSADQEHVFTRFWRGDASRTRNTGGAGLGLAIVSSIVSAHGGTSDVISQVGQGTTIRVRLPARQVEREHQPS
jgi:two-component system OmpR family sensor kinase